jgi:site-specific DNA-methyltransferase (adenine-specific)
MTQAQLGMRLHNPDVLTCIANLSNDEVFTPPELANQMLDALEQAWADSNNGACIWADQTLRFLDPFTKSGVFLREITRRLTEGLASELPDLPTRIDHILTKQIYGLAITDLTSLLARRTVYCSKWANGEHSIANSFTNAEGNIWFDRKDHLWEKGNCRFCGGSKAEYDRGDDLESHAYAFIHTDNISQLINDIFGASMHFDVIIGNPPYQLSDGGHQASAKPIYNHFIDQAKNLDPRYICMVVPSRWFTGGKGLKTFRTEMLGDKRLRKIVDFIVERDAFPGINLNGGVNYFIWDRDNPGECEITTVSSGGVYGPAATRSLDEFDLFVRRNEAIPILRKVMSVGDPTFDARVSTTRPFGLRTYFHGRAAKTRKCNILLYGSGQVSWIAREETTENTDWIDEWKVLIPAATDGNEVYPLPIWDKHGPFVATPGQACTETYLVAACVKSEEEARRVCSYMRTKFFRFLVHLRKPAQHNKADVFRFVPDLVLDHDWTDEELYQRYGLSTSETEFIDTIIRTMEFDGV